jgi:hypothetical protein
VEKVVGEVAAFVADGHMMWCYVVANTEAEIACTCDFCKKNPCPTCLNQTIYKKIN